MPEVRFLPDVVAPEFTAGWGEDSDGDGLPDIYEVLVTQTDPADADTGHTGTLDGYKGPARDGWSNLEKFRRRVDPFVPDIPPSPIELQRPTLSELWRAVGSKAPRTDLHYQPEVTIRKPGEKNFHAEDQNLQGAGFWLKAPPDTHVDFDVRIVWGPPQLHPQPSGYSGP
jgi:hypothetical protein